MVEVSLISRLPTLRGRVQQHVGLADLTWLRVGGPAEVLVTPADTEDLAALVAGLPADVPLTILGVGSNMIVREGGIPGVVVRLSPKSFGAIEVLEGQRIRAGAAVLDQRLAKVAAEAGIGGFAFLAGIPGTIGGALKMNAGAHGGETKDLFISAEAVTPEGRVVTLGPDDLGFNYRHSAVPEGTIFKSATFQGTASTPEAERDAIRHVQDTREATQPIKSRTAGSTFKNPPGQSSWRLIDAAGLRGFRMGGAHMSTMHPNFLINDDGASAYDVELLGEIVRRRVFEHSGVKLEWEVKRLGVFADGRAVEPAF
jgi:UDP-N-acetylmuramate dehydrogenase